jgi:hypothetical protein
VPARDLLDRREPLGLRVEPVHVAVEREPRARLGAGHRLGGFERLEVAVNAARHIERLGFDLRRAGEDGGLVAIVDGQTRPGVGARSGAFTPRPP